VVRHDDDRSGGRPFREHGERIGVRRVISDDEQRG
jgi:hypothetical protein